MGSHSSARTGTTASEIEPRSASGELTRIDQGAVVRRQELVEDRVEHLRQRREPGATALLEQAGADLPFQIAHGGRDRRLRTKRASRGGPEAAGVRRDKVGGGSSKDPPISGAIHTSQPARRKSAASIKSWLMISPPKGGLPGRLGSPQC